jgi:hypothetical protein
LLFSTYLQVVSAIASINLSFFAFIDTAEQFWQAMTEVTGFLVILLSKLPEEKKLAIKNDVTDSLRIIFPSGGPIRFTGELILGTGTKPNQ